MYAGSYSGYSEEEKCYVLRYKIMACLSANLGSEATEKSKNELTKGKGKILVKEVTEEDGHPMVGLATMYQQQSFKVPITNTGMNLMVCTGD